MLLVNWYIIAHQENDECLDWHSWDGIGGSSAPSVSSWILGFIAYISLGTLFAVLSVVLVVHYAPYASGSGIPEGYTVLT